MLRIYEMAPFGFVTADYNDLCRSDLAKLKFRDGTLRDSEIVSEIDKNDSTSVQQTCYRVLISESFVTV